MPLCAAMLDYILFSHVVTSNNLVTHCTEIYNTVLRQYKSRIHDIERAIANICFPLGHIDVEHIILSRSSLTILVYTHP